MEAKFAQIQFGVTFLGPEQDFISFCLPHTGGQFHLWRIGFYNSRLDFYFFFNLKRSPPLLGILVFMTIPSQAEGKGIAV